MNQTQPTRETRDHDEIRAWAEQRGGLPATVSAGRGDRAGSGTLRIHFPDRGAPGADLRQIPWDEFFRKFDEASLTFVYAFETDQGGTSRFHKFIRR